MVDGVTVTRDTSDRRQRITAMLHDQGSVQVLPLSGQFKVSSQTIRKDLQYLEDRGVATRCYGGAILAQIVGGPVTEPAVETKRTLHAAEKDRIGRFAASLVKPGESIVLDSGTTTAFLARHLRDDDEITVVTNDAGVLTEVAQKQQIQIVMLGGALRRKNMAFYGAQTEAAMDELLVDKLFLGVDGIDLENGITTHYEPEAMLNRRMVKRAREVIAVTDGSKFGRTCMHRIINATELSMLITDESAPAALVEKIRQAGVRVEVVPSDF
ncbi:transcriptional repressor AgaR [Sphingomonas sp. LM7]|uniref:transcriptional repressor AgaR n=1 Tax=Sphingomonas sp. LM7 TaxID=1938607 RepID=UPI000983AB74|nr:transcriptional repressor AgaR [Sphingomonas sp. LM7]AQR75053.1 DeoR family transcriptional regulator [Sphingomonas sp. LM7]